MHKHVAHQVGPTIEPARAGVALIWLFSCMQSCVSCLIAKLTEPLGTTLEWAWEGFLIAVNFHVVVQNALRNKGFIALGTT